MSVLVQLTIFPVDKGESLSDHVCTAVQIIKESGLSYELGPMGTSIEGEWEEIQNVVTKCFEALQEKSNRLYMVMTADYRRGANNRITDKVSSIEEKLK